jgi:hypothetical protein
LHILAFELKLSFDVSAHLIELLVELRLDSSLFDLKSLDVYLLRIKHFALFVLILFDFEFKPLLLALLDSSADAFVAGNESAFLVLELLFEITLIVSNALLSLHLNVANLFFLLELEFIFE